MTSTVTEGLYQFKGALSTSKYLTSCSEILVRLVLLRYFCCTSIQGISLSVSNWYISTALCCRDDMVLRKDVEARRLRWTVTDTAISRDSAFLLYSSISQYVHLVNLSAGSGPVHSISNITEVHEELDFLVCFPIVFTYRKPACNFLPGSRGLCSLQSPTVE